MKNTKTVVGFKEVLPGIKFKQIKAGDGSEVQNSQIIKE